MTWTISHNHDHHGRVRTFETYAEARAYQCPDCAAKNAQVDTKGSTKSASCSDAASPQVD